MKIPVLDQIGISLFVGVLGFFVENYIVPFGKHKYDYSYKFINPNVDCTRIPFFWVIL
jgi:hypothetical protein